MDWTDLGPRAGPPAELRATLAQRGGAWSSELDVLDAAIEEMARRRIAAGTAVAWSEPGSGPRVALVAPDGICLAQLGSDGALVRFFTAAP